MPEAITAGSVTCSPSAVDYHRAWRQAGVGVIREIAGLLPAAWLGMQMLTSCPSMKQDMYQFAVPSSFANNIQSFQAA
jgi:hypothetical protein